MEESILRRCQVAGTWSELMCGGEEDAEAASRCNFYDASLLVDERGGGREQGTRYRWGSFGGGGLVRVRGGSGSILVVGSIVGDYDGGLGDRGRPTTGRFVVVVIGSRSIWEIGMMGSVRSIAQRIGGVYHSQTGNQTMQGVDKEEERDCLGRSPTLLYPFPPPAWHRYSHVIFGHAPKSLVITENAERGRRDVHNREVDSVSLVVCPLGRCDRWKSRSLQGHLPLLPIFFLT